MSTLFICGDILNTGKKQEMFDHELVRIIQASDFSICNFEAPGASNGNPIKKVGPAKQQRIETISMLKDSGFDLLLLANNHIFDYGRAGLESTINEARRQGLDVIGAALDFSGAYTPIIKNIGGLKFGFLNFSEAQFGVLKEDLGGDFSAGYAWINHPAVNSIIIELRKEVDFIVLFAHAGLERYDLPLIEWRNRYREFCDLGIDFVIGSHPHVVQGYEVYNGRYIFYSLGNFYFTDDTQSNQEGISIQLEIAADRECKIEIIHHSIQNGTATRIWTKDSKIDVDSLNYKLRDEYYQTAIEDVYKEAFWEVCFPYFSSVHLGFAPGDTLKGKLKKLIKMLFFYKRGFEYRLLMLLHLVKNETYRYITERYIEFYH